MNRIAPRANNKLDLVPRRNLVTDNHELLQYEQMINTVPIAMALIDQGYSFLAVNDSYLDAFAKTRKEVIGIHMEDVHCWQHFEEYAKPYFDKALAGERQTFRIWDQISSIGARYLDINYVPCFDEAGCVTAVVTSAADITDMMKKEMMLNRYEQIVNSVSDHITYVSKDLVYEAVNGKFLKAFGKTREQVVGRPVIDVVGENNFERISRPNYKRALAGETFRVQSWSKQPGEGNRYMDFRYFPFCEEKGEVCGVILIAQDITDSHQAEINLDLYNAITNKSTDYLTVVDKDFHYLVVNDQFYEALGTTREKMLGSHIKDIVGEQIFESHSKPNITRAINEGYSTANIWSPHATLGNRYVDIEYTAHKNDKGELQYILITGHDITELKQAQMVLEQRERELSEAQRRARLGLWQWDLKTKEMQISPEIRAVMCNDYYEADWFLNFENVKTLFHPEDREEIENGIKNAFVSGELYDMKHRIIWPDGEIRCVHVQGKLEYKDGEPYRMVGTTLDITNMKKVEEEIKQLNEELEERVERRTTELQEANTCLNASLLELKETQNQLIQSEKMASLGGLVAGVAHEINTPVGMCVSTASFLNDKISKWSTLYKENELTREDFEDLLDTSRESLDILLNNLNRSAELIRSFKQVAVDRSSEKLRKIFLKSYIEKVLQSLKPEFKRNKHSIVLDCPAHIQLLTHPGAISQILINLLMNSLFHGFRNREDGQITIQVTEQKDSIRILYQDDGVGISDEVRSKIFEPFFTTNRTGGGSGLGMHIVFNLVNQTLQGTISCVSRAEQGAAFSIDIPSKIDADE